MILFFFFFQAEDGIRDYKVTGVQTCALPISLNDASEVTALRAVFGPLVRRIPVSSTKSLFGHALGAAGGLEAVVTVMALETQVLPPTVGWKGGDESFDLDIVPGIARPARIRMALSNNFGFGGGNCTLAFAAAETPWRPRPPASRALGASAGLAGGGGWSA